MARPERNTVDYFPYLCDEGEKMYYIDERYGNDGFATFIKILTHLARTDYHYLDLSKKTTQMFLSAKCKVSTEILNSIISDLSELGKFNLMLWNENKIIWCQDFIDSIQDAYKKRNNECISFDGLLILLDSLGVRKLSKVTTTTSVKPQSKVEYIKEDKTKENETIENEVFSELKSDLINSIVNHFNFSANTFHKEKSLIMGFVQNLEFNSMIEHFTIQFNNYLEYKKIAGYPLGFKKFIGTQSKQFDDAEWNSENWKEKLKDFKNKNNGTGTKNTDANKVDGRKEFGRL